MAITQRFNIIALWVAKIIVEGSTLRVRVRRMSKLIEIAGHLYAMNNFSTLMAFIAGFSKAGVQRLRHTIRELPVKTTKRLAEMERLMSAESSYKSYRAKIHTINPPCIPYIGVYLLDLTYIEDGNPNSIGRLINFSKRRLIYTLIREVQLYQDQPFQFKPVEEIMGVLAVVLSISDDTTAAGLKKLEDRIFELSLQKEPRGADRSQIV